tara:strand:- start:203 stop:520 length:318 start_codon:yes stop_codon:yes gene_type:complete
MKKLLFKFLSFLNKRFLQLILFVFACLSWAECSEIGRKSYGIRESGITKNDYKAGLGDSYSETISGGAAVDVSTGFDGGALAMGLITCMCIFGIVWIEISRKSKP